MTEDLAARWEELLDVLAELAPRTRAALLPPVPFDEALAARLPEPLTPMLRQWFSLHNGAGREFAGQIFPQGVVLSLADAVDYTLMIKSISDQDPFIARLEAPELQVAASRCGEWHRSYVLIADEFAGGGLFVD